MKLTFLPITCLLVLFSGWLLCENATAGQEAVQDKAKIREIMKHIQKDVEQLTRSAKDAIGSGPGTRQNLKMTIGSGTEQKSVIYYHDNEWNVIGQCEDPPGVCRPCPC